MNTLIVIVITLPIVVSGFAVLLAKQVISPGSEWPAVVAIVSMYFAAFGALQTYEGSRISKQIQDMGKAKEQKRRDVLIQYEIPHVLHALKMLKLGMYQTMVLLKRHTINEKIQTKEGAKRIRQRAIMHIEAIHSLGATFFDVELSKYHKLLDSILVTIDEIVFVSQNDKVDIAKFKESIYVVSHMIRTISTEYNIDPQETDSAHHNDA